MKTFFFLIVFSIFASISSHGQMRQETTIARTGDTLNLVLSKGFQYLYPNFIQGNVHFNTGEVSTAFMNYNILLNEIHFITRRELDALNLETERDFLNNSQSLVLDDIDFVVIGADVFVNTPRGIMVLVVNHDTQLLQNNKITMQGNTRVGAYGQVGTSAAINAPDKVPSKYDSHGDPRQLQVATQYTREEEYFLYRDGRLLQASRRGFERVFPNIRSEIRKFVSDNNTSFTERDDLKKLLVFCIENSNN